MDVGVLLYRAFRPCPAALRKGLLQRLPLRLVIQYYAAAGIGLEQLAREGFKVSLDPGSGLTIEEQILDYAAIQGSRAEFAGFLIVHPVVTLWNLVRGRFIGSKEEFDVVVRESLPILAYTCLLYSYGQKRGSRLGRILRETLAALGPYGLFRLLGPAISADRPQLLAVLSLLAEGGYNDLFTAVVRGYAGVLSNMTEDGKFYLWELAQKAKNPSFSEVLRQLDLSSVGSASISYFYWTLLGDLRPENSRSQLTIATATLIASGQWGPAILDRLRQKLPKLLSTFQAILNFLSALPEHWPINFSLPTDLQSYIDVDPAMSTIFFFLAGVLNRKDVLDSLLEGELRKIILYRGDDLSGLVNFLLFFQTEAFQHPRIQAFLAEVRQDRPQLVEATIIGDRLRHNPEIIRQLHWLLDYHSLSPIHLPPDLARHPEVKHMHCSANMLLAFEPETLARDLLPEPNERCKPWSLRRKLIRPGEQLYYRLVGTSFHCQPGEKAPIRSDLKNLTGFPGDSVGLSKLSEEIMRQDGLTATVSPFRAMFVNVRISND